jgi:hypothetical protein
MQGGINGQYSPKVPGGGFRINLILVGMIAFNKNNMFMLQFLF